MTTKKLFRHIFAALLFSVLWSLVCFLADEGDGGIITESFYDTVKKLPFVGVIEYPTTFIIAFVIYPILFYTIGAIIYSQFRRFLALRRKPESGQSL